VCFERNLNCGIISYNMEGSGLLEKYLSQKTALLVVDMQNGYIDPEAPLQKLTGATTGRVQVLVPTLEAFINSARELRVPIFWTQFAEDPAFMPVNFREKMLAEETPALTTPGEPTYDFYRLSPLPGEVVIHKKHYNAFTETDLDKQLKSRGTKTVIISGIYASRCVAATAFGAADDRGYQLIIPEDLVSGADDMEIETKGFLSMAKIVLGEVTTSAKIREIWQRDKS
jgi:ureidoacrylate peracid hydrolase